MLPIGAGRQPGDRAKNVAEPIGIGVPGLACNALDLAVGRGEKRLRQLDAPDGDEPAHPLAHLIDEAATQVLRMDVQLAGDAADGQLGIGKVLLNVL